MIVPKVVSHLALLSRVSGSLRNQSQSLCRVMQQGWSIRFKALHSSKRCFTSAADNKHPPKRYTLLEPELEEVLVPRKLSVSPLESWLSLRFSLPPLMEGPPPVEDERIVGKSVVLPPSTVPLLEDDNSSTALNCKNVLEIRRRKMNRHKYKKLLKRTKFLRRRVKDSRRKKKQAKFEMDLIRIARRAGLRKPAEGWVTPKVFVKQSQSK